MNAIEKINALDLNGLVRKAAMKEIGKDVIMGILAERGTAKLLAEKLQFANSGALSAATGDLGWREVGHRGDTENQENAPKTVKRMKGILPYITAKWAIVQLTAAYCAAGGDAADFECPELTPEVFQSIPAFQKQRDGWMRHVEKLGGIEGPAARDFRAWLGVPLTDTQAQAEAEAAAEAATKRKMESLKSLLEEAARLAGELVLLDVSNGIAETLTRLETVA